MHLYDGFDALYSVNYVLLKAEIRLYFSVILHFISFHLYDSASSPHLQFFPSDATKYTAHSIS